MTEGPAAPSPGRWGQLPALLVLALVGAGLATAWQGHWRIGPGVIAAGLLLGSGLRLVLPPRRAGWLVVRSRLFDAGLLLAMASAMVVLAATIPRPRV